MNFNLENTKNQVNNINKNNVNMSDIFDKNKNFYICSSGGCGSTILSEYLSNFGNVKHIHDRYPPDKLCYIGKENTNEPVFSEWFNSTEIPDDKLKTYKVIFIYRNPLPTIFSRFALPNGPYIKHMQHIKCVNNGEIHFGDILKSGKDLYGLENFFDNYTIPKRRNYDIYCVKYEQLFDNINLLNNVLGIPDIKSLYPIKYEKAKKITYLKQLLLIYSNLINKMNNMPFIKIVKPINDDNFVDV